jgi:hypothetical protein
VGPQIPLKEQEAQGLKKMYDPNLGITYHEKKGGDFAYMDPEEELYYKKRRAGWIPTH